MPTIKIYSTPTCVYCKMLKSYLDEKKIAYQNIDVAADPAAGQEMVKKSGQMGVPVTIINIDGKEEIIVGFDKERLNNLLGIKS